MLLDKLELQDIQVGVDVTDWKDAIRKSAAPLVKKGSIEESYIEGIIESVNQNGPYFIITKHIALAHTRPEYGVKKMDLNFTLLNNPVNFGKEEFDPIKMIITLAAKDPTSHLDVLAELTDVLIDEELVNKIFMAETSEEVYGLLRKRG